MVDEAVAHGIDAVVADADGPALVALADAARYAGRKYLAERVLRAQRTRFPGSAGRRARRPSSWGAWPTIVAPRRRGSTGTGAI